MSMEQAILELAAGMKELAAAVRAGFGSERVVAGVDQVKAALAPLAERLGMTRVTESTPVKKRGELVQPEARAADGAEQPISEEIKAVSDEIEAKDSVAPADLDYTKDVRPVLLAVNKKAGQPALKALLTKFGAATGDKLKPEQFTDVLAEANKILAG